MDHIKNRPTSDIPFPGGDVAQVVLPEPNMVGNISPWRLNFRQIEPGAIRTHIRARTGQILSLLEIAMDRSMHQQGAAPPETLSFGMSLSRSNLRWQGTKVGGDQFLTFGDTTGFEGVSDSAFHGITFSVPNAEVEALADRLGMPIEDSIRSSGVFHPSKRANGIGSLSELALRFLRPAKRIGFTLEDEEEILALFLQAANTSDKQNDNSTGQQRARAVRLALETMEGHVEDNISISRICEMSGVSLRTLNRAFREAFGIGPKAYYLRMRLGLLRRALYECDPSRLVSDLANPLGFWHMGQLAQDYRGTFGELPSETRNHIGP